MHKGVKENWYPSRNAWCLSNGIRTVWCDPKEYEETVRELEAEYCALFD